jgi:hypothetical protein
MNFLYKFLLFFLVSYCGASSFAPNPDAGRVSVSVDEESLQNLLSVYENTGSHDFGTMEKLNDVDEIKRVDRYYLYNWKIDLSEDDLKFSVEGTLDAQGRKKVWRIPLHPYVHFGGLYASADVFFQNLDLSDDGRVNLSLCIADANVNLSDASYGYGDIMDELVADGFFHVDKLINKNVQNAVDNALIQMTETSKCINITRDILVGYPEFSKTININHVGTKVENKKLSVYGCPTAGKMVGGTVVINNNPCETVSYSISVYTSNEVPYAGTASKITLALCGDDIHGVNKCFSKELNGKTGDGEISHLFIENSTVLVNNLSLTLDSDNSGKYPDWYVDSVIVDMKLPNNSTFHYWFPINRQIGGPLNSSSYTFRENDNLQVYEFQIETGDQTHFDHAGTDSYVLAKACDIKDKCLLLYLQKAGRPDFEAGTITKFSYITEKKLDNLKSLTLYNLFENEHPGWYVQDVVYRHYSFPENIDHSLKDGQVFMFRQWLADGEYGNAYYRGEGLGMFEPANWVGNPFFRHYVSAKRYVYNNYGYDVAIKTRDGKSGDSYGTDANITLTIEGCSGEKVSFDLNDDVNNFEKGSLDYFRLSDNHNLKGIKKVTLHNDGSNSGAGWDPEYIIVTPVSYQGVDKIVYDENKIGQNGLYNKPYGHAFSNKVDDKIIWEIIGANVTWESPEVLSCADVQTPAIYSETYVVHPDDFVQILGINLDKAQNIGISLKQRIGPLFITNDYALFYIPSDTPLGIYNIGSVVMDGVTQPVILHVVGAKPILDGLAISIAEPGDAFEASMRNINSSSRFYLGEYQLKVLDLSSKGVYLQIPRNMENGVYKFRVESDDLDITYDETIKIIKSIVPHVLSVSENPAYTGQIVVINGKNFGYDEKKISVFIGDKKAEIKSLENEMITIQIPAGVSGQSVSVSVLREEIPAPENLTIDIKGLPWFMSFDDLEHPWTCDNAELSSDEFIKYGDIGYSLKIHGDGYKSIVSPVFNTYELGAISDILLLDVWIPEEQKNPYWKGDVQMSVDIPAAGLYNVWIGQVLLTELQSGWNTIRFELNEVVYKALAGDYPNATFTIMLNANQNADDFRIDNLRFGGNIKTRTTEHVAVGRILDVYSAEFMSFDNINDWNVSSQELLFVENPKIQGLGATGVNISGYNEIRSRSFYPAELKFVSNVISLDVFVPNPQPNDYWVGDISIGLNCPDIGINSVHLGEVQSLTHMFRNEYNNVQFLIPDEIVSALRYGVGKCSFSVYLNVNNGAGLFLLDNMGFVNVYEVAKR